MEPTTRLVSGREAAEILGAVGVPRETARRALHAGLAGVGVRQRNAVLYDGALVQRLAQPSLTAEELPAQMRGGTFAVRIGAPGSPRSLDLTAPFEAQTAAVCDGWRIATLTRVIMQVRHQRDWSMPFVATIAGFAVLGADIVDAHAISTATHLTLAPPGPWFDAVHRRRLPGAPPRRPLVDDPRRESVETGPRSGRLSLTVR